MKASPALTYGRARPLRRRLRVVAVAVVLQALFLVVGWHVWERIASSDYYTLRSQLDGVPGITYHIGTRSDEDGGPRRIVQYIEIFVGGDRSRRIVLWSDGKIFDAFDGTGRLFVGQFGHLYFPDGLTFDGRDPFTAMRPLPRPVRTAHDLIAHYDEILAAMEKWPRTGTITDPSGKRHTVEMAVQPR